MEPLVLVIDSNLAVQAIATAGLKVLGVRVEAMSEGKNLLGEVHGKKPRVVICSEDLKTVDPYAFCSDLKAKLGEAGLRFVLLASSEKSKKISEKASAAGIDYVLYKPFKSDQLRKVVKQLIEMPMQALPPLPKPAVSHDMVHVAVCLAHTLSRKIVCQMLRKRNTAVQTFDTPEALAEAINGHPFMLTVADANGANPPSWYQESSMGTLVLMYGPGEDAPGDRADSRIKHVGRPLSVEKLDTAFKSVLPVEERSSTVRPLAPPEQAHLAARVSAVVFEQLLNERAFRERRWEDACKTILSEALRVCQEYKGPRS